LRIHCTHSCTRKWISCVTGLSRKPLEARLSAACWQTKTSSFIKTVRAFLRT
jgi:hypothetical protein